MWSNPKYRRAVIGLIIGVMLGVVLSRVLPYLLGTLKSIEFRNVAQHTDQLVERYPFASASVLAIIFGALFALPEQIKGLILLPTRLFRPAHVLELLFTDESEIHLIIPYMAQREFARIDNNQRIQLPDNAPFLPATHGIAIGRLEAHVREVFKGKKRIRILGEDRPERVETWGELEALVVQLLAQISGERGGLIVGQFNGHPGEMGRLTIPGKAFRPRLRTIVHRRPGLSDGTQPGHRVPSCLTSF